MRDLTSIYAKLLQVLYPPKGGGTNQLLRSVLTPLSRPEVATDACRDWDLWGPLVICLSLAIVLSIDVSCPLPLSSLHLLTHQSPPEQSMQVFSLVISLVTIGSVVVTINSKLLGGKVYVCNIVHHLVRKLTTVDPSSRAW